jgi:hypothetical protein
VHKLNQIAWIREIKLTSSAFWLFSPISILAFPVSLLVANENSSPLELTTYGFILTFITYAFYLALQGVFNFLSFKSAFPKLIFFLASISATGLFRGYVFYQIVDYLELNQPSPLTERLANSVLTTLFWLTLSNIVVSISRSFKLRYDWALNQMLSHEFQAQRNYELNLDSLNTIESKLKSSVEKYLGQMDLIAAKNLAESIKAQINDEIRPLSQRIWIEKLDEFPATNKRLLLKDAITSLDSSKSIFLLILTLLSLLNNLFLRGLGESLLRTVTTLFMVLLLLKIFDSKDSSSGFSFNLIFLILLGFVPVIFSEAIVAALGYQSQWIATLLISPIPPVLLIVLSVIELSNKDRKLVISALNKYSHHPDRTKEDLALYLHNTLQSELLALSSQLEEVAVAGDKERLPAVLERVSALINKSLIDDFAKYSETPLLKIESLISAWRGIMQIEFDVAAEYLQDPKRNVVIARTVEEVITNAFRRGKASKIHISGLQIDGNLELFFETDGVLSLPGEAGLGSKWFDSISIRPWVIEESSKGVTFKILL